MVFLCQRTRLPKMARPLSSMIYLQRIESSSSNCPSCFPVLSKSTHAICMRRVSDPPKRLELHFTSLSGTQISSVNWASKSNCTSLLNSGEDRLGSSFKMHLFPLKPGMKSNIQMSLNLALGLFKKIEQLLGSLNRRQRAKWRKYKVNSKSTRFISLS